MRKYIFIVSAFILCGHMVFGLPYQRSNKKKKELPHQLDLVVPMPADSGINLNAPASVVSPRKDPTGLELPQRLSTDPRRQLTREDTLLRIHRDSLLLDSLLRAGHHFKHDSIELSLADSLAFGLMPADSLVADSIAADTAKRKKKNFLDDVISGQNKDSLVYDVRGKMVYIYTEGDVKYQEMNLKADYMEVSLETKEIYAYGYTDSLGKKSRPEFIQKGDSYTMDTIHYNITSEKAKIKGVARQEGEGYLIGRDVKKMKDNSINIMSGKYTTCDHIDCPHFYLAMTRAKVIPGKKVIVAPSYLVMEDVPIYFLGLPFGFFPVTSGRSSGLIIPTFGEEYVKGFFLRDGGYYFAFNDYIDVTVLGGIYTLGSWQASLQSRYTKRYKYSGGFNIRYTKDIIGDKLDTLNYVNQTNFNVQWTHQQDPKFKPNSTFSASVNFGTSGFTRYGTNNVNENINSQISSSVSYSKSWAGKPYSLSASFSHSQNSQTKDVSMTLPSAVFNVSRVNPFKRKNAVGKEKWYEKIAMTYTANLSNSVNAKESELFKNDMLKKMKTRVEHSIPVSTSWTLFSYINVTPSFNYNEKWYFRKEMKEWDPVKKAQVVTDTTYGFYRVYNYSFNVGMSTKMYGMYTFKRPNSAIKAIRHMMTPSLTFSYTPDFGAPKYGFYKPIQTNESGEMGWYTPYESAPGRGKSMSMSFSLSNTLEMKVKSEKDTTGVKKLKLIDDLRFSGGYNFMAKEFKLNIISASFRSTIIPNFGINVDATFDPYQIENVNGQKKRVNKYLISKGKLARLATASTSFGYTFNSSKSGQPAVNDINSGSAPTPEQSDFFNNQNITDPNLRRTMMTSQYYDFNLPWNFGFNYSFSYNNTGVLKSITQTLGFNGSLTLTEKWGITFNGGYDFKSKKFSHGLVTINRDLHCWQMNFSWVPIGYMKSWSFNISVKSNILRDLKYDKRSSRYDTLLD